MRSSDSTWYDVNAAQLAKRQLMRPTARDALGDGHENRWVVCVGIRWPECSDVTKNPLLDIDLWIAGAPPSSSAEWRSIVY